MPFCLSCGRDKHQSEFHADGRSRTGFSDTCEDCFVLRTRERHKNDKRRYRADDPEKARKNYRRWHLGRNYGLTPKDIDNRLLEQNGCAICHSNDPNWDKGWHVDHDHSCCPTIPTCGTCVRGILCHRCNMMIGLAQENIDTLESARRYLSGELNHGRR